MSNQSKSMLVSGIFFLAFCFFERLMVPLIESTAFMLGIGYILPLCLAIAFWVCRYMMKRKSHWHISGTVWIDVLLAGLFFVGFVYIFIFNGNMSLFAVTSDPWFRFYFIGMQFAVIFFAAEILFAIVSGIMKLISKSNPSTPIQ